MTARIVPFRDIAPQEWDRFCLDSSGAWFWHGSRWLAYQEARGGRNLSFAVADGSGLLAVCPLILEHRAGGASLSMEGLPGPWPAFRNRLVRHRLEEARALVADRVEAMRGSARAAFRSCPLAAGPIAFGPYRPGPGWESRIVNLGRTEEELHARLRKSYRSLVNKGFRELQFVEGNGEPEAASAVELCRKLHLRAAGRETRPRATWAMMADWVLDGKGWAVIASRAGKPVAFAYFVLHRGDAYYASGASLEPDVQHAVIWRALLRLRARSVGRLELGWQGQAGDAKGKAVEFFKAGFPGEDVPVLVSDGRP